MLPILLAVGAGAVAAFALRVVTRPDTFRVERSAVIDAPPERVYPLLVDFREWRRWSPWEALDPDMSRSYSGPESGVGSTYEWSGNRKAGAGRMVISAAEPARRVALDLSFTRPMEASNVTEFLLNPRERGTEVRWLMHGPNTLGSKMFQSVVSMDRMVGRDFEQGLANLGRAAKEPRGGAGV